MKTTNIPDDEEYVPGEQASHTDVVGAPAEEREHNFSVCD